MFPSALRGPSRFWTTLCARAWQSGWRAGMWMSSSIVNHREDARRVHVDMQLAKAYRQAAGELSEALGVENDLPLSDYMNMPDVLTVEASRGSGAQFARCSCGR